MKLYEGCDYFNERRDDPSGPEETDDCFFCMRYNLCCAAYEKSKGVNPDHLEEITLEDILELDLESVYVDSGDTIEDLKQYDVSSVDLEYRILLLNVDGKIRAFHEDSYHFYRTLDDEEETKMLKLREIETICHYEGILDEPTTPYDLITEIISEYQKGSIDILYTDGNAIQHFTYQNGLISPFNPDSAYATKFRNRNVESFHVRYHSHSREFNFEIVVS